MKERGPVARGSRGQSLVEMALTLPLLLLLVFGIIEFGRILNAYIVVTNAAREGARYGAVGEDEAEITSQVMLSMASLGAPSDVDVVGEGGGRGNPVTVTVTYDVDLIAPLFDVVIPDPFPVTATARMRIE
jgi:Flp pilus assembly protein TadG